MSKRLKHRSVKKLDSKTKAALSANFKPTYKGLVLFISDYLLKSNLSYAAKLVYAGLFYTIPKDVRIYKMSLMQNLDFTADKSVLIKNLGISRSLFYEAINELEKADWLVTHKSKFGDTVYYELKETYGVAITKNSDIKGIITSEMLKRKFIKLKNDMKSLTPMNKIILGLLAQQSFKDYDRKILTSVNDLSSDLDVKISTLYYIIDRFSKCSALAVNKQSYAIFSIYLLDEYIQHQMKQNNLKSGTYNTDKTRISKTLPVDDFDYSTLDKIFNSIK